MQFNETPMFPVVENLKSDLNAALIEARRLQLGMEGAQNFNSARLLADSIRTTIAILNGFEQEFMAPEPVIEPPYFTPSGEQTVA